jgi:hypothetical protein
MNKLPTPIPVDEALRENGIDISVPAGTSLTVGPFEAQYSQAFRLAEVRSFTDLHRLGFIRKEIAEDQLTKAIHADDRTFRESVQHQRLSGHDSACSCEDRRGRGEATPSRRHVQSQLIELLQPLYRQSLTADDLLTRHTYGHAKQWLNRPARYLVGLFVVNDITVGDNATLTMTPTVERLNANEISIGNNGHLSFTSGNIHVRCRALHGPSPFTSSTLAVDKYVKGLSREIREVRP